MAASAASFSSSESFGLFMEGLRALKLYTEESERDLPSHTKLDRLLTEALQCLGKCESFYPNDTLPLYSLGLALTMKNQLSYARFLRKYGRESERSRRSAIYDVREPAIQPQAALETSTSQEDVQGSEIEYLPPPLRRAWPLLDHAEDIFQKIANTGPPALCKSAVFNHANVCSKRDAEGDLDKAEHLLNTINQAATPAEQSEWPTLPTFRKTFLGGRRYDPKPIRTDDTLIIWIQSQTLLASVTARKSLRSMLTRKALTGEEPTPGSATAVLTRAKLEIAGAKLPAAIKTDLEADYWTRAGLLAYEQAFADSPTDRPLEFNARLDEAGDYLGRALQLKENWNPAQIYLAQVLQAQGRFQEAETYLDAVLGKSEGTSNSQRSTAKETGSPSQGSASVLPGNDREI